MKFSLRSGFSGILFKTLLAALLGLSLWWALSGALEKRLLEEQKAAYRSNIAFYGSNLSLIVNTRLALANSLEAFTHTFHDCPDLRSKFTTFAEGLYAGNSGVRAIQVFPPDGLMMQYPLEGNEAVARRTLESLLHDTRPQVAADVARAVKSGELTLSGPYELNQGGQGLIARKAVFRSGSLWGFAVVVLDMPPLLKRAGFDSPESHDLLLALKDDKGVVFFGSKSVFASDPVYVRVKVLDREWTLAAVPSGGWGATYGSTLAWFRFLGLCTVLLVAVLVFVSFYHGYTLRSAVRKATEDLRESEGRLKEAQELGNIGNWEFDWNSKKMGLY